jgi:glycosyltransferase involved in cell wall biosynthesis
MRQAREMALKTKYKICFATPGVYPILEGIGPYGGSELRAWRLARHLVASEVYEVSMLAFYHGQSRKLIREGVVFQRDDSYVETREIWPLLRGRAIRAMRRGRAEGVLDFSAWECKAWAKECADLYIAFGVTCYSAKLARWCAASGRRLMIMLGSDMDLDPVEPGAHVLFDQPCVLVAQTEFQRHEVRRRYGLNTHLLQNPVTISAEALDQGLREFALWVGKSDHIKCPDRMIQLARLCPDIPVTMIMNRADAVLFDAIKAEAPPNVKIIDAVEAEYMSEYYRRAFALVSTSRIEGFANSFLEAGACGTPVLSMVVDPDGYIEAHGGGILSGEAGAASELRRLHESRHWAPGSLARMLGENAYQYVKTYHDSKIILAQFAAMIETELAKSA